MSLTARSTIQLLLKIFTEHGIPSSVCCDQGRKFVSSEFGSFWTDIGIKMSYSSAYHHSSSQVEHAIRTIKVLMKWCHNAGVSWRLAAVEFLSTPGPDEKSLAELCGCQFKGIMPILNPKVNEKDADLFSERKEKEKLKFDTKSKKLLVCL